MKHKFAIGTLLCGVFIMPISVPSAQAADPAEVTFTTDGNWTVPTGVEIVEVNISGGVGGNGGNISGLECNATGGDGAAVTAGLNVGASEVVYFGLGADGSDCQSSLSGARSAFNIGAGGAYTDSRGNGGGGGGASAIAIDDTIVVIVGGGGGAGGATTAAFGTSPNSGDGGGGGANTGGLQIISGVNGNDAAFSDPTGGKGGVGGSESNGTIASTLKRTGPDGGGSGAAAAVDGFNVRGGGGGAGYYGGLAGNGGGGDLDEAAGGGGGGGTSYVSYAQSPILTHYRSTSLSTTTPTGTIKYVDITTSTIPNATVGTAFTATLAAIFGASGSVDEWAVSPALPTGITLNAATGVLSGTATATSSGTYTFTATKNTSGGNTSGEISARSNVSLSFTVAAEPTPDPTPSPDPSPNTDPGSDPGASTGTSVVAPNLAAVGSVEFNLELGINAALRVVTNAGSFSQFTIDPSLPAGLALEPTTGIISGTPTELHRESVFEVTASNSLGQSKQSIRLSVSEKASTIPVTQERDSVRFKAGSAKLRPNLKRQLNEFIDQKNVGTKIQGQVRLTGVIPKSGNGSVLARKRAVQVRKYLRANNVNVSSMIRIEIASDRPMTRRVVLND